MANHASRPFAQFDLPADAEDQIEDREIMERPDAWLMTDRLQHEVGKGDPFAAAIRATRMPMIITDPRQPDNPIVFANDAFLKLTGYERNEVTGRNCRFLQGVDTDRGTIAAIREAIRAGSDVNVDLLNYRKDGTPFWNALYISPVTTSAGELQYFFASQLDVTERQDALKAKTALLHEVDHRVKNNLQMISALINMEAKRIADPQIRHSLNSMMKRVEALSTVHRRLYQSDDVTRFSVAEFVNDIIVDLVAAMGRGEVTTDFDLEPFTVPADKAASLALMVNELATNVLKHAFVPGKPGRIFVKVIRKDDRCRIEVEDNGVGMSEGSPATTGTFGLNLVTMLAKQLRATVTWSPVAPAGTSVVVEMPMEQLATGA